MTQISRRNFVAVLAAAPAGVHALDGLFMLPDDRELLIALADVILPSELGSAGVKRNVEGFEKWVSNFRPGAEQNHGYGTGELQRTAADPWPRWRTQLAALDADARRQYRSGFAELQRAQRRAMVGQLIEGLNAERVPPSPIVAEHVALGLLGWFYNTPEATDLAYRAKIGKETCRPLGENANPPRPL